VVCASKNVNPSAVTQTEEEALAPPNLEIFAGEDRYGPMMRKGRFVGNALDQNRTDNIGVRYLDQVANLSR
jgi:hypothetical protein